MNLILEPNISSLKFEKGLNNSMEQMKIKLVASRTETEILPDGGTKAQKCEE